MSRPLATFDFETDHFSKDSIPAPFVAGYYEEGQGFQYWWGDDCAKQAAEYMATRNARIFAHNGGKFDYFYLLDYLGENMKIINGRITQAKLGKSTLFDSFNILPVPLKAIQKDDFDYTKLLKSKRDKYKNEILSYLRGDCTYLYEAVNTFQENYGRRLTVAGTAMNYFKEQCRNIGKKPPEETTKAHFDRFKPFYYGGRVQAFKTGVFNGPFEYWDINSAYPYACANFNHPTGKNWIPRSEIDPSEITQTFYHIKCVAKGAFPYRPDKGSLSFPDDDIPREYKITGWELKAALETKTAHDIEVIKAYYFPETINMAAYMDDFFCFKETS